MSKSRKLFRGAVIVLGAGAILQPAGAAFGLSAQETPKKDDSAIHQSAKSDTKRTPAAASKSKSHKKGGKKKAETPKKEGI